MTRPAGGGQRCQKAKARALSAASKARKDKERLEGELKEKISQLQAQEKLEGEIKGCLEADEALQAEYQAALDDAEQLREASRKALEMATELDRSASFWKGKDAENGRTIASLQRQMRNLKDAERISGFERTIREDKSTIRGLLTTQDWMRIEAKEKDAIVDKSRARTL